MANQATQEYRSKVADMFVQSLKENQLDWKSGWSDMGSPVNAVTQKRYKGINYVSLLLQARKINRENPDNRWATFRQISEKGWKVRKGAKGTKVEYFTPYNFEEKKNITWDELAKKREEGKNVGLIAKYYVVFNGHDIEGIPPMEPPKNKYVASDELLHKISSGMKIQITNDGEGRAFYRPSDDTIHLPVKESFLDSYEYNSTALHELSHATGAEHRLHRNIQNTFGTKGYAYEELVAEISSCFMGEHLEIKASKQQLENHKAYVQSWIQSISQDPDVLVSAIREAEKAANYLEYHAGILTLEEYKETTRQSLNVPERQVVDEKGLERKIPVTEEEKLGVSALIFTSNVDIKYAFTLRTGETVDISFKELQEKSETIGKELVSKEVLDACESILNERVRTVSMEGCSIMTSMNPEYNCCVIRYYDYSEKKEDIIIQGDKYGITFNKLNDEEIKDVVRKYTANQLQEQVRQNTSERDAHSGTVQPTRKLNVVVGENYTFNVPKYSISQGGFREISGIERYEGTVLSVSDSECRVKTQDGKEITLQQKEIYDDRQTFIMEKAVEKLTGEALDLVGQPALSAAQMEQVYRGLIDGLVIEQAAMYATPKYTAAEMDLYRYGMENGLSFYNIEDVLSTSAAKTGNWGESRGMLDKMIKAQRNIIIKDLKDNGIPPEKRLVNRIEKINGLTGKMHSVKELLSQVSADSGGTVGLLKEEIYKDLSHQKSRVERASVPQRVAQPVR